MLSVSVTNQVSSQPGSRPPDQHRIHHLAGDSLPLPKLRNADFIDVEFGRLVGMAMQRGGGLPHDLTTVDGVAALDFDRHDNPSLR